MVLLNYEVKYYLLFGRDIKYCFFKFQEHRRTTMSQTSDKDELSTSRIQILKRNKSNII
jgi:hypothetical protein